MVPKTQFITRTTSARENGRTPDEIALVSSYVRYNFLHLEDQAHLLVIPARPFGLHP